MSRLQERNEQHPVERLLVLGDVSFAYPTSAPAERPLVVLPLEGGGGPAAVDLLRATDPMGCPKARVRTDDRWFEFLVDPTLPGWTGTALHPAARTALAAGHSLTADALDRLTPLVLLRTHRSGSTTEVLACSRLRAGGVLFTRIATIASGADEDAVVDRALDELHRPLPHLLSDTFQCTGLSKDVEIETKLSLSGTRSSWALASRISTLVGTADLPGFVPDLGNEVQRWQSSQRTWEVLAPKAEAGYLALMDFGTGTFAVKRKRFQADALRREETFRYDIDLPAEDLDGYMQSLYPDLELRRLPSHRRSKFDVNVQSVSSGHFFGIEIDEIHVLDSPHAMSQLEIEYHRSVVHDGLDAATIEPELLRLTTHVRALLATWGEDAQETTYSKLSFLRDLVDHDASPFGWRTDTVTPSHGIGVEVGVR